MTQEEKELILKDLCTRLPYGVKVQDTYYTSLNPITPWLVDMIKQEVRLYADENWQTVEYIKSYLRPMSSMTEAEKIELCTRAYAPDEMKTLDEKLYVIQTNAKNAADFYNEHHIDYRGLIPIGLALEAPEDMYNMQK